MNLGIVELYHNDGGQRFNLVDRATGAPSNITHAVRSYFGPTADGSSTVFLYDGNPPNRADTHPGRCWFATIEANHFRIEQQHEVIRTGGGRAFTHVLAGRFIEGGSSDLLFYDFDTGEAQFYTRNARERLARYAERALPRHWVSLVAGQFTGAEHGRTDLFAHARNGEATFYRMGTRARVEPVRQIANLIDTVLPGTGLPGAGTELMIVPGLFGTSPGDARQDAYTDLFFYCRPAIGRGPHTAICATASGAALEVLSRYEGAQPWAQRNEWAFVLGSSFVRGGAFELLFYDRDRARADVYRFEAGRIRPLFSQTFPTWEYFGRVLLPVQLRADAARGPGHTDLLLYDPFKAAQVTGPGNPTPQPKGSTLIYLERSGTIDSAIVYEGGWALVNHTGVMTGLANPNTDPFNPITLELVTNGAAVATVEPGSSTTPDELVAAFGSATPALPIRIRAIARAPQPQAVPINIPVTLSYRVTG